MLTADALKTLPLKIGSSSRGPVVTDVTDFIHMVIGGETGSGKSNLIHFLLLQLLNARNCLTFIIDLKRLEYEQYKSRAALVTSLEEAVLLLRWLYKEMKRRQDILAGAGVVKIQNYPGEMPFIVCVIDELSQICPEYAKDKEDKKVRQLAYGYIFDLLSLSRATGIHLIMATQRPDADVLPGALKANTPAAVAFQVKNSTNSKIILDNTSAAYLPPIPGRCIFQHRGEIQVQVPFVKPDEISRFLSVPSIVPYPFPQIDYRERIKKSISK
jgi:DNA segregation ATPase FtsK/SpoIIIE-like protein